MGEKCKKCGLSLQYNNHNEDTCDFVPIDWDNPEEVAELTYVEDIQPEMLIKSGYGLWEQTIILEIMEDIWRYSTSMQYKEWKRNPLNLFYAAQDVYEEILYIYGL